MRGEIAGPGLWHPHGRRLWTVTAVLVPVPGVAGVGAAIWPMERVRLPGLVFFTVTAAVGVAAPVLGVLALWWGARGAAPSAHVRRVRGLERDERRAFRKALRRGERVAPGLEDAATTLAARQAWSCLEHACFALFVAASGVFGLSNAAPTFRVLGAVQLPLGLLLTLGALALARRFQRAAEVNEPAPARGETSPRREAASP